MRPEKTGNKTFFSDVSPIDIILGGIGAMLMVTTICLLAYAVSVVNSTID